MKSLIALVVLCTLLLSACATISTRPGDPAAHKPVRHGFAIGFRVPL